MQNPLPAHPHRRHTSSTVAVRISLITRHADARFTPLALLYLKAALVDHAAVGADDITILEFPPEATVEDMADAIHRATPDVLAASCYVWNVIDLMTAIARAKARLVAMRVVVGGPEVGPIAERVLGAWPAVDVVVKSEGEGPMVDLVTCWRDGGDVRSVTGIWTQIAGRVREHPDAPIALDLDALASPHRRAYVGHRDRIVCVETQRGCVFRCSFCFYNKDLSIRNRRFDLDRVFDELGFWLQRDVKQLYLMDPVFNLNAARAKEICRFLIAHNTRHIPVHAEIWAEFVDDELAALMKAAHFDFLEVGLQTTDAATLATVDRRLKMQPFLDGIGHLRVHGLAFEVQLILGLPGDTLASFRESLNFAAALRPEYLAAFTLMVLPGTELWRQAGALDLVFESTPPYFIQSTPGMSADDIDYGRRMAPAVRRLWNSRAIWLLSREDGMTFAGVVEDWVRWSASASVDADSAIEPHLVAFVEAHCRQRSIAPQFYVSAAGLEVG